MAPSQCLGHKPSRYDACNVARIGGSLDTFPDDLFRAHFCSRASLRKTGVELGLELGEKKHTLSRCARRNFNKFAEGVTFLRLEAGLISPGR